MRDPDVSGQFGRAWLSRIKPSKPDHSACLACWVMHRPGAHPAWAWYVVTIIHLRDIPGVRPAVKRYPEAALELSVYALDPDRPVDIDEGPWHFLMPCELEYQFHGVSDRDATRICETYVRGCVVHGASPDSDLRLWWMRHLDATVDHFRSGAHVES